MKLSKFLIIFCLFLIVLYLSIEVREGLNFLDNLQAGSYSYSSSETTSSDDSILTTDSTSEVTEYTINNLKAPKFNDGGPFLMKENTSYHLLLYDYLEFEQEGKIEELIFYSKDKFKIVKNPNYGEVELSEQCNQVLKYTPNKNYKQSRLDEYDEIQLKYIYNGDDESNVAILKFKVVDPYYPKVTEEAGNQTCKDRQGYLNKTRGHLLSNPSETAEFCKWDGTNEIFQDYDENEEKIHCIFREFTIGPQSKRYYQTVVNRYGQEEQIRHTIHDENVKVLCKSNPDIKTLKDYLDDKEKSVKQDVYNRIIKGLGQEEKEKIMKKCKKNSNTSCKLGEDIQEITDITNVKEVKTTSVTEEIIEKVSSTNDVNMNLNIVKDDNEEIENTIIDDSEMIIDESNEEYKIDKSKNTVEVEENVEEKMIKSCGATIEEAQAAINVVKDESINTNINNSNVFINTGDNVTISDVILDSKLDFIGPEVNRSCILEKMKELDTEIQKNLDVEGANNIKNMSEAIKDSILNKKQLDNILKQSSLIRNTSNNVNNLKMLDNENLIKKNIILIENIIIRNGYFNDRERSENFLNILDKFCEVYIDISKHSKVYCGDRNLINDILNTEQQLNTLDIEETIYLLKEFLIRELNTFTTGQNSDILNALDVIVNEFCYNFLDKCVNI